MAIPLIWLLLWACAGITAIVVAVIKRKEIVNWFRSRAKLKQSDKNNIAFTIKQEISNGNYTVCQGIFNNDTSELLEAQKLQGKIDEEFAQLHQNKPLVVYE